MGKMTFVLNGYSVLQQSFQRGRKEEAKKYSKDTPEKRAKKMKEFKVIGMEKVRSPDHGGISIKKRWKTR